MLLLLLVSQWRHSELVAAMMPPKVADALAADGSYAEAFPKVSL